jgi:integration host factor subunit alpha
MKHYTREDAMKTLTKEHLIQAVCNNGGHSKRTSTALVESLLQFIKSTLASGEDVLISGFGKFCVKGKNERRGRNPATGNDLTLGTRRVVTFRCSSVLKEKLNQKK